jgi:hypothetical protein
MASWAAVLALTGFRYSAPTGTLVLGTDVGRFFWSTGNAWGTCELRCDGDSMCGEFRVTEGEIAVRNIAVAGSEPCALESPVMLRAGDSLPIQGEPPSPRDVRC